MYVCICNAVTEDDVRSCVASGAGSAKEVRAAFGMRPGCGTCTRRLCALVSQGRTAKELMTALGTAETLEAAATAIDAGLADVTQVQTMTRETEGVTTAA